MGVPFSSEGRSPSDFSPESGSLREVPGEAAAREASIPPAHPLLLRWPSEPRSRPQNLALTRARA